MNDEYIIMPAGSAVDCWFKPLSCQAEDYNIDIFCCSAKH